MRNLPNLFNERVLWEKNYLVVGIDEVGRGAFAGPLTVAAVVFNPTKDRTEIKRLENLGINDSKKLTPQQREYLEGVIKKTSQCYAYASIGVELINKIGIGKATHFGVRKLVKSIRKKLENERRLFLLIDAFYIKYIRGIGLAYQKAIIHGDEISLSIAAASILAKVKRDTYMKKLASKYPEYGFERHVGYGTVKHREAIRTFGVTETHRSDFVQRTIS